ncbi:MAG: histidinol-phosphate aminotransferase family protein [Gemmatimonadetes bacterium]|nr:histidinol-phosphate aminotransferase family protein [Gemmatimonadota bacterium]MBI3504600.1 histidinol-phosphate aminotransferase family protein [Pseudomonadota bacterium]
MTPHPATPLARDDFATIPRYSSDAAVAVNLADNTNLWGTPPAAQAALAACAADSAASYPSLYGEALKAAVARTHGVPEACVVTGNGSDDLLDCAVRAFARAGDAVAHPDPTFVMFPVFARINGLRPVAVPLTSDHEMDADALLATGARIIYLCTPNNPTGTPTRPEVVRRIIAEAPGLVIVDEAYAEFSRMEGLLREAPALERVLVCRTMSKAYGLAGLRAGYGVASPSIVDAVERSRGPYKLSAFAEAAAVAAMTADAAWVRERAAEAVQLRERLAGALGAVGFTPLPSDTNFLCVPTARAGAIAAHARTRGIALRAFADLPGLGPALRITVGPWPLMERALDAIGSTS